MAERTVVVRKTSVRIPPSAFKERGRIENRRMIRFPSASSGMRSGMRIAPQFAFRFLAEPKSMNEDSLRNLLSAFENKK